MPGFILIRNKKLLSDEDVYRITSVSDLNALLKDRHSLCVVWRPVWLRDCGVRLTAIRGIWHKVDGSAEEASLCYCRDAEAHQSAQKNGLDRSVSGKYLFVPWKKDGVRRFRIVQQGKILAEYLTLDEALADLIPGNFEPKADYERKLSVMDILGLQVRRACEYHDRKKELVQILLNRIKQLEKQ